MDYKIKGETLTDIADVIRDKTSSTDTMTPEEMPTGVEEVFEAGKKAGSIDWDLFQDYGNRTDYTYAFRRNWYDEIYNPKYPIGGGNMNQAYFSSKITNTKQPIVVKGTVSSCFQDSKIKTIVSLDLTDCTNLASNMFYGASDLESVTFVGLIKLDGLNISYCSKLDKTSLLSLLDCLEKKTDGGTWRVILGPNLKKLTDDEQKIATEKGWELKEWA